MNVIIGIACEDNGHFTAITRLVDDVLVTNHDWLDGIFEHCRHWVGVHEGESWYKYDPNDAQFLEPLRIAGQTVRRHGHIGGERRKPEAGMWRNVLMMFCAVKPRPDVVILVRDMDGYRDRLEGAVQVRDGLPWPFKIAIAAAQPEIEAWWVSGFVPNDEGERRKLDDIRQELSFNPTLESHRLTSHPNDAATDSKRVLHSLCGPDNERQMACLADHALLRARGRINGLELFMTDVDERIVPVFRATK